MVIIGAITTLFFDSKDPSLPGWNRYSNLTSRLLMKVIFTIWFHKIPLSLILLIELSGVQISYFRESLDSIVHCGDKTLCSEKYII